MQTPDQNQFTPTSQSEQETNTAQPTNLFEFRESQNLSWDKRLEMALSNYDQLMPTLESFTQEEWDKFILCICKDELPFYFNRGRDNDCLFVEFCPLLEDITQDNKDKIRISITTIISRLNEENGVKLTKNSLKEYEIAFLLAYSIPIKLEDKVLLKNIATKSNQEITFIVGSCRNLITKTNALDDIEWWKKVIKNKNGHHILPMVFANISKNSHAKALDFLNEQKDKIEIEAMEITIRRFLSKIVEENEENNFTLESFPECLHEYIISIIDLFEPLKKAWDLR